MHCRTDFRFVKEAGQVRLGCVCACNDGDDTAVRPAMRSESCTTGRRYHPCPGNRGVARPTGAAADPQAGSLCAPSQYAAMGFMAVHWGPTGAGETPALPVCAAVCLPRVARADQRELLFTRCSSHLASACRRWHVQTAGPAGAGETPALPVRAAVGLPRVARAHQGEGADPQAGIPRAPVGSSARC
jgi:hypothetical protein